MKVPAFLQIEPKFDRDDNIVGGRVVSVHSSYPRSPRGGTVLVYLELLVPDSAFGPIAEARVEIPESSLRVTVDVEVPDVTER